MEIHIWWAPLERPGLEQLYLEENEIGVVADSLVLGIRETVPFRLWYQVRTDRAWNVQECLLIFSMTSFNTSQNIAVRLSKTTLKRGPILSSFAGMLIL
jgi:hypothetical protein